MQLIPSSLVKTNIRLALFQSQVKNGGGQSGGGGGPGGHVTSDDVKAQPWYYGHITRSDCDQILTEKGQDGDFIIRESETNVSSNSGTLVSCMAFLIIGCHFQPTVTFSCFWL